MGLARLYNGYSPRLAGLRRVVRRGDTFICGVCRSCYDDEREALSCIDRCWQETLQLDPVVLARRALKSCYRCRFCARDYNARQAAESCARDCLASRQAKYAREAELSDLGGDLPPPPRRTPRARPVFMAQPMARSLPRSKRPVEDAPVPQDDGSLNGDTVNADVRLKASEPPAIVEAPSTEPKAEAPKKPKATDDSEKFYRDGAQYVCKECSKKHFTRIEVIKCYDEH
jgi:hypothetical protein